MQQVLLFTFVLFLAFSNSQLILSGGNVTVRFNILDSPSETAVQIANRMLERQTQNTLNAGYPILALRLVSVPGSTTGVDVTTTESESERSAATPLKPMMLLTFLISFFVSLTNTSIRFRSVFTIALFLVVYVQYASAFGTYQNCKLMDGSINYRLYWTLNGTNINIGVTANAVGWVAFGVSKDGTMDSSRNGSDIALGFINPSSNCPTGCVTDYQATVRDIPLRDPVNNILSGTVTESTGVTYMEFTRPLAASEPGFDRAINPNTPEWIIYAAHQTSKPASTDVFSKHTMKGAQTVQFSSQSSCPTSGSVLAEIVLDIYPDNFNQNTFVSSLSSSLGISANQIVVESVQSATPNPCPTCTVLELRAPNYLVPQTETYYQCFPFDGPASDFHVIRMEPIHNNSQVTHHVIIFQSAYRFTSPFECGSMPPGTNPMYGWAPGTTPLNLPDTAAYPIGPNVAGAQYLVIQYHYNNPGLLPGQYDSSGVRLFMIPKTNQRVDAGTLFIGTSNGAIAIPPQKTAWHISANCTVPSLGNLPGITIFGAIRHAHTYSRMMWIDIYRGGNYLGLLTPDKNYDFNFQTLEKIDFVATPGTRFVTHCVWNTLSTNQTIYGGESTSNEMCLVALFYYPIVTSTNCYGPPTPGCDYPC